MNEISLLRGPDQRVSEALDILWNTVKTIINKRRKYGTTVTSPRTGRPGLMKRQGERAGKRPAVTLKELQEYLANTDCSDNNFPYSSACSEEKKHPSPA